jgi:surface antigen Omp85-like protein
MRSNSIHQTSRGDPRLHMMWVLALILGAAPCVAQTTSSGPADAVARTATHAVLSQEVPDDQAMFPSSVALFDEPAGFFAEPRIIARAIQFTTRTLGDGTQSSNGFYPEFSNMVTGSGWIAIGPGYRQWLYGDRAVVDASAGISWRSYKMAQARFELTRLARSRVSVGTQLMWQDLTQVTYFGVGPGSSDSERSEYRLTATDVVGYATLRPRSWLSINGRAGWLGRPAIDSPSGTFKRGNPSTIDLFVDEPAIETLRQPNFVHTEMSATADTRDSRSHPTNGGVYRGAMSTYSDRGAGTFSFERYEAEAAQFVDFFNERVVLAGHGWIVGSATSDGHTIPFYLLPSLGGHNTLRGYTDYRFHDRNLLVVNGEIRVALIKHVDVAGFVDAGNVAPRVAELNLDKRDYGIGLRLHTNRATFARVDVAHGTDGWRFLFRTSDPFHLSRLSRRVVALPFAP